MLKVKEVAERLKVHPQTVYRWIYAGKLEVIRIDGIIRITEDIYQEFISGVKSESQKPS